MRHIICIVIWMIVWPCQALAKPAHIVSFNLCADQLVLALADSDHIAAITKLANDSSLSVEAEKAKRIPVIRGDAEEVLQFAPDLVLGGAVPNASLRKILGQQHVPFFSLDMPQSISQIENQIGEVAKAMGEEERGRTLIANMQKTFKRLSKQACQQPPRVAFYYPSGFTDGKGTLMQDVLDRLQIRNVATEAGIVGMGYFPLEHLVAAKPDVIFVSRYDPKNPTQGEALLAHPVLKQLSARMVELPGNLLICGNHHVAQLAELVAVAAKEQCAHP